MGKVLAVDDSATMRQMVATSLKEAGHQVSEASDGNEALRKCQSERFDLVITDVNMPNKDGLTLIKELRGVNGYRFTPILFLTTESRTDLKEQAKASGATGWLVKPFKPDQLMAAVGKVLR